MLNESATVKPSRQEVEDVLDRHRARVVEVGRARRRRHSEGQQRLVPTPTRAIATRAGELAARIEDLALEFEQRMEAVAKETKKLRQLQELLRSIA